MQRLADSPYVRWLDEPWVAVSKWNESIMATGVLGIRMVSLPSGDARLD
jgi:hypothetical protein